MSFLCPRRVFNCAYVARCFFIKLARIGRYTVINYRMCIDCVICQFCICSHIHIDPCRTFE